MRQLEPSPLRSRHHRLFAALTAMLMLGSALPARAACFLWRVERGDATAYLAGSLHFADEKTYPLDPAFELAFEHSDVLDVEADVRTGADELPGLLRDLAACPPGGSLGDMLSPESREAFRREGLEASLATPYRPWYVLMALEAERLTRQGFRQDLGIDVHFLDLAHARNMPVRELEGVAAQLRLLAEMEEMDQDAYVRFSLLELRHLDKLIPRMARAWKNGDVADLEQIFFGSPLFNALFKSLNEKLYFRRNRNMAAQILDRLDSGKVHFVVVGAGHVIGRDGLLQLLRARGCALTQL